MLILMDQGWPWLVIGLLLCAWAVHIINISLIEWIQFLIRLPFVYFSDNTETEKEEAKQTLEEVSQANPGCFILGLGVISVIVGIVKVFI